MSVFVLMYDAPSWGQSDEALRGLCERYWDATMERHPEEATSIGDYRFNDRLQNVSQAAQEEWKRQLKTFQREAYKISATALNEEDRLTSDLLVRSIADKLLRLECRRSFMPLNPLNGPQVNFPLILVSQPFRHEKDFQDYISRLRAFPMHIHGYIMNMRDGTALGWVSPRVIVEKVVPQIKQHIVRDAAQSIFYEPAEKVSILPEALQVSTRAAIAKAVTEDVVPGFFRLLAFVEDEYLPQATETVGIGSLTSGQTIYGYLTRLETTVDLKPQAIHELGLREVARLRQEMSKVQKEIGYEGTLEDFLKYMRSDPQYRFTSGDELVAAADAILQRTKPRLPQLFNRLPKADCVMKEIESYRAVSAPVAYYNGPPQDGTRPAYYYINTYKPQDRLRFTLEALTYHEAVPGHHLQVALHQESVDLPMFQRHASFTAYIEGWALYTEKLGYDMGGYQTPQDRFGQLTFEIWRACRLVVDTGIHHNGWSRQQSIDYMLENTSLARLDIEAEVDRYISWPGQACAYKIGELRISQLRQEAEAALGDRFDLRAFHDAVLTAGPMPIDVLEQRVRNWMTRN